MVRRWSYNKADASPEYTCPDPPTIVSIVDCTSHMSDGEKKDATYIMDQFWKKLDEIDIERKLTDCFIFNGASNVQTAA